MALKRAKMPALTKSSRILRDFVPEVSYGKRSLLRGAGTLIAAALGCTTMSVGTKNCKALRENNVSVDQKGEPALDAWEVITSKRGPAFNKPTRPAPIRRERASLNLQEPYVEAEQTMEQASDAEDAASSTAAQASDSEEEAFERTIRGDETYWK